MANYLGYARSNYFKVKDEDAFKVWVDTLPIECRESKKDNETTFMVMEPDGIGWPTYKEDDDGEYEDIDFAGELSEHLADGWVAIIKEVGYEKMRYLHGYIEAINNKGGSKHKLLEFKDDELKELGEHFTDPSY